MRTNSNKKVHKMARDPYKMLLKLAVVLAVAVAVGVGVFYLCTLAVNQDYINTRNRIEAENAEGQVEFNTRMIRQGKTSCWTLPVPCGRTLILLRGKRSWMGSPGACRMKAQPVWRTPVPLPCSVPS